MADKYLEKFAEEVLKIKNKKNMIEFFESIFTPHELDAVPKRLEIVKKLKNGVTHRNIASTLKVGIATVTRGARELKIKHFKHV